MPDRYWAPDKGLIAEELVKDTIAREKAEAERAKEIPADGKYKLQLPAEFKPPEGINVELKEDDPLLAVATEVAAHAKLTQKEFDAFAAKYAGLLAAEAAAQKKAAEDEAAGAEADLNTLGPTRAARVEAVTTAFKSAGAPGFADVVAKNASAAIIKELEAAILHWSRGGATVNGGGREPPAQNNQRPEDRWYAGMNDKLLKKAS